MTKKNNQKAIIFWAEFGSLIAKARAKKGYTLHEVETLTGIKNSNLSAMEHGKTRPPSAESISKLAETLEIDLDIAHATAKKIPTYIKEEFLKNPKKVSNAVKSLTS